MKKIFKVGDVVRIFEQPKDSHVHLQGKIGVVDDTSGVGVVFIELNLNGECNGSGAISNSYLEPVTDPKWLAARDKREAYLKRQIAAMDEATEKRKQAELEARLKVGSEFGISANSVKEIVSGYSQALSEELSKAGIHDCGY